MTGIEVALWLVVVYLVIGAAVGGHMIWREMERFDPIGADSGPMVRLVLWPGASALWPVMAIKWLGSIRRGGALAPRPVRGIGRLRVAHVVAWAIVAPLVLWGLYMALMHRAEGLQAVEADAPVELRP